MIEGLSHMTFIAQDLDAMEQILTTVLDAKKIYDSGDTSFSISKERFFLVSNLWIAVMEGEALPHKTYNHIAFKISDGDYGMYLQRIRSLNLEVKEGRTRIEGEGRSIYFYDRDNHMFELHTGTLDDRLASYAAKAS
jgi:catechol 2,3-dioxygenase-like lactoylglutathione lyase family enzyme